MSTANSKLKIDFGFDSYGTSNVEGDFRISGNVFIGGTVLSTITTAGDFVPLASGSALGNTTNRWDLRANNGNFTNTVTIVGSTSLQDILTVTKTISGGNTTINGFVNASAGVNTSILTIGAFLIANATGTYHSGTINAASFSTSGFTANATAISATSNTLLLGTSTGRFVISANTGDFSGDVTISGNTTVNNATLNGTLQTISGNVNIDSGTLFVDAVNNRVGVGITNPGVSLDVSGSANISSGVNSSLFTVGSILIGNTSGIYHTGNINAASHAVGTDFIANSTTVTSTGSANLTTSTSTIRVGNSTVNTFVNSSVVLTSVGNFITSSNVGSNVSISTSGVQIGNSTSNLNANSVLISVANSSSISNISSAGFVVGSFNANSSTVTVNVGSFVIGANVGSNVNLTTSDLKIGNSTSNMFANSVLLKVSDATSTANLSPSSLTIGSSVVNSSIITISTGNFSTGANVGGNVNLTTSSLQIGNSTVNTQVNSSVLSTNTGNFSLAANVGANVKLTTVILSVGNSTVNSTVNSTTVFTSSTGSFSGPGTGLTGNATSLSIGGSATFLNAGNYILRRSGSGNYNTDFSNTPAGSMSHQGDDSDSTNNPGAGWWFLDNYRHSNGGNTWGTQVAWGWEGNANRLATRNITSGTFGAWVYYLNSSNYNSYAPTLTGTGASGSWGINITGSAGSATSATTAATATTITITDDTATTSTVYPTWVTTTSGNLPQKTTSSRLYFVPSSGTLSASVMGAASFVVGSNFIANTTGIWSSGDVTAYYSSDERLKSNIVNIDSALDKVMQLNGVMHDWNDTALEIYPDRTHRDVGVIAQQVEKVLPEIVITRDTGFKAVRYERLIPLLIEAIKELKQEINELKNGNSK